jgi:D-aminopeptidase
MTGMDDLDLLMLERRVDRLLAPWDRHDGPGMAVGVVRDEHLVLHRQVGMASLELGVKLAPDSVFRIASVSKQFTCAAILMLAAEGRLSVDDAARTYLPELPDYGAPLTIDHLMHNTSGLRDMLEIMRLGGADLSFACTSADLLAAICRQRGLNFTPGSRYLYSNSSFMLLGLIAERVSGIGLPAFLDTRIFAPLGMTRTRMTESTIEPVAGLATGYQPRDSGWVRAVHGFPLGGEGGLVSCVEDLALWARNMTTGRVGGAALVAELERQAPFTKGTVNSYARGLQVRERRGVRMVDHGGSWPGYRTHFLRAPALGMAVICISNDAGAEPAGLAQLILQAAIEDRPGVQPMPSLPTSASMAGLPGPYLDRVTGATLQLDVVAGAPVATLYGNANRLEPAADGRLEAAHSAADFVAAPASDGHSMDVQLDAGTRAVYHRVAADAVLPADLVGTYGNDEIAATWRIAEEAGEMVVRVAGPHVRSGPWAIEPIEGDVIRIYPPATQYRSWLDARVQRDAAGAVSGLAVNGGRARLLVFDRRG